MIKDGQKIELGDTIVTIVETPGHTPGCVSLIFSVKENETNYNAVLWGGTGAPSDLEGKLYYRKSIDYFEKYAHIEHATVEITAHLFCENGYSKLETVRNRKDNETNPFLIGEDGIKNYFDNLRKQIDYMIEKQKNKSGEN